MITIKNSQFNENDEQGILFSSNFAQSNLITEENSEVFQENDFTDRTYDKAGNHIYRKRSPPNGLVSDMAIIEQLDDQPS